MGGEIGREGKAKCEGHKIGKGRRSKGKEEDDPTNIGNKLTLLMVTIQTPNHSELRWSSFVHNVKLHLAVTDGTT